MAKRANTSRTPCVAFFLLALLVTTALMFAGLDTAAVLKLNLHNPQPWQLLTSSYIHENWNHYAFNMGAFTIVAALQLALISRMGGCRKWYLLLLLAIFLLFPLISALERLAVFPALAPKLLFSCGSSDIVSALIGAIPALLLAWDSKREGRNLLTANVFLFLLGYFVLGSVVVYAPVLGTALPLYAVVMLAGLAYYGWAGRHELGGIAKFMLEDWRGKRRASFALQFACFLLALVAPFVLLPANPMHGGVFTDFITHQVGFAYGLVAGFICFKWSCGR